jgi:hypothetical protein
VLDPLVGLAKHAAPLQVGGGPCVLTIGVDPRGPPRAWASVPVMTSKAATAIIAARQASCECVFIINLRSCGRIVTASLRRTSFCSIGLLEACLGSFGLRGSLLFYLQFRLGNRLLAHQVCDLVHTGAQRIC